MQLQLELEELLVLEDELVLEEEASLALECDLLDAEDWLLEAELDELPEELDALLDAEEPPELDEALLDPEELLLFDAEELPLERELEELLLLELDELLELLLDELPREPEPLLELLDPEAARSSCAIRGLVLSFDFMALSSPYRSFIKQAQSL